MAVISVSAPIVKSTPNASRCGSVHLHGSPKTRRRSRMRVDRTERPPTGVIQVASANSGCVELTHGSSERPQTERTAVVAGAKEIEECRPRRKILEHQESAVVVGCDQTARDGDVEFGEELQ